MDVDDAALVLKELGHPHRLRIFKRLVKSGFDGLPVGTLRDELDIPNSSMTHHVASLVKAGLIIQERDGRTLRCVPQYPRLWNVISFLESECCLECESTSAGDEIL
ncbi:ArsR family transcriptional regulator [Ruegeria sp. ANG-R]|uniref:ArsR/SmtB family transcription factor n=1 Tax=Ruegeria sp. ANG-R TaxID=1577903 RepID=UPI00057CCFB1|nr:helix-turn-helix domain-containing protein [Ruegeria sp. ANG-R]KIC38583.1 ArsR family transcriptional regulator [Ruegeria sp. ANG-R]